MSTSDPSPLAGMNRNEARVIIVDDDEFWRRMLTTVMQGSGFSQPRVVSSFQEGLQHFEAEEFDLGLVDIMLGTESGLDLIQRAREHNPNCAFLVITAATNLEMAVRAVDAGAAGYISKPLPPIPELCDKLDRALAGAALRKQVERLHAKVFELEAELMRARSRPASVDGGGPAMGKATALGVHRVITEAHAVLEPLIDRLEMMPEVDSLEAEGAREALKKLGNVAVSLEKVSRG
ncbi:MAG: response regulator [Myxococcota bacterium]